MHSRAGGAARGRIAHHLSDCCLGGGQCDGGFVARSDPFGELSIERDRAGRVARGGRVRTRRRSVERVDRVRGNDQRRLGIGRPWRRRVLRARAGSNEREDHPAPCRRHWATTGAVAGRVGAAGGIETRLSESTAASISWSISISRFASLQP